MKFIHDIYGRYINVDEIVTLETDYEIESTPVDPFRIYYVAADSRGLKYNICGGFETKDDAEAVLKMIASRLAEKDNNIININDYVATREE